MEKIKFKLAGCHSSFIAEAPSDMTVKQLIQQASRINPWGCDCGVRSLRASEEHISPEIIFYYDNVIKTSSDVECDIKIKIWDKI